MAGLTRQTTGKRRGGGHPGDTVALRDKPKRHTAQPVLQSGKLSYFQGERESEGTEDKRSPGVPIFSGEEMDGPFPL